jgi:hypothetical protein
MTDPAKRKLSAKQILADIRSGMDAPSLKREHGLSDKSFEYVLKQLVAAGLLTPDEMLRLEPPRSSLERPPKPPAPAQWQCPACNALQPAEMAECPACGVVVAKFVERQEQRDHESRFAPRFTRDPDAGGGKGLTSVIASIVILALIGGTLLIWSAHRAKERTNVASLGIVTESTQQAESEADRPEVTSEDLAGVGKEYSEFKIEDDQEKSLTPPDPIVALPQEHSAPKVEPPPTENPTPASATPKYVTGVLRQFGSGDFKREVVEASKTYPVLFQFYSNT